MSAVAATALFYILVAALAMALLWWAMLVLPTSTGPVPHVPPPRAALDPVPGICVLAHPAPAGDGRPDGSHKEPDAAGQRPYRDGGNRLGQPHPEAERWALWLVNLARERAGLPAVRPSVELTRAARARAGELSQAALRHVGPGPSSADHRSAGGRTQEIIAHLDDATLTSSQAARRHHRDRQENPCTASVPMTPAWTRAGTGLYRDHTGWWVIQVFEGT